MGERDISAITTDETILSQIKGTLALAGPPLKPSARILDLGCGSGSQARAFLNAGYDAYGVDLQDWVIREGSEDQKRFRVSLDPYIYRLPFPDNFFDVVYSARVLEHVVYYEPALKEMRRVLKPDGVSIHIFPSKWRPIEGHFRAPFGGAIRWWPWLKLWALLGMNNRKLPKELSRHERALVNWKASRTNYTYYSMRELKFLFGLFFSDIRFVEREFVSATRDQSSFSSRIDKLAKVFPAIFWLYRHFHTRVVVLSGYSDVQRNNGGLPLF